MFDELSPFTGKRRVLVEADPDKFDNVKLCMDTGYHTYERSWKDGSDVIPLVEANMTANVLKTKVVYDGNVWYCMYLVNPFLVLTPEYKTDDIGEERVWALYSLKGANPEADEIVMEIDIEDGVKQYRTFDTSTRVEFPYNKFEQAMDQYQQVGAAIYGQIAMVNNAESTE